MILENITEGEYKNKKMTETSSKQNEKRCQTDRKKQAGAYSLNISSKTQDRPSQALVIIPTWSNSFPHMFNKNKLLLAKKLRKNSNELFSY